MIVLILICVYGGIIYYLVHRLKQIQKNPKKFDAIPGYEEYTKSIWYWPTYREFGKGTPPDNCGVPATGLLSFSCRAGIFSLPSYIFRFYVNSWGRTKEENLRRRSMWRATCSFFLGVMRHNAGFCCGNGGSYACRSKRVSRLWFCCCSPR